MRRLGLLLLGVMVISLLSACNRAADNTLPPSPLVQFKPSLNTQVLWSRNTGNGDGGYYLRLVPAASNGVVYTDSHNGTVTALNANNGAMVWQVSLRQPISSGVDVGGGAVYLVTESAQLYALSQKDGHVLWHQSIDNQALAQPRYASGYVLVHTISGTLAAYSATDGHLIWRLDQQVPSLTLYAAGQPQVAGNFVVAGFANGELVVANLSNGRLQWERHVAYPEGDNAISQMVDITVNPVVVDGIVYAATYQGQVAAYSLDDGQLIWQHKISSYAGITANQSQVFVSDAESRVWAFDENSGGVNWRQTKLLGRQITGPVIYKNTLVVADRYGYLHFMSLYDGRFLARLSLGNGALAQPISYKGNLYVYTSNGNLIAVRAGG